MIIPIKYQYPSPIFLPHFELPLPLEISEKLAEPAAVQHAAAENR
jgi:hypothetical protein